MIEDIKKKLSQTFKMKDLGELKYFSFQFLFRVIFFVNDSDDDNPIAWGRISGKGTKI